MNTRGRGTRPDDFPRYGADMIETFRVQNFKALRDVTLNLTPIHLLIGQNDSGKTSLLEAMAALCRSVDQSLTSAFAGRWRGLQLVTDCNTNHSVILECRMRESEQLAYRLGVRFKPEGQRAALDEEVVHVVGRTFSVKQKRDDRLQSIANRIGKLDHSADAELRGYPRSRFTW